VVLAGSEIFVAAGYVDCAAMPFGSTASGLGFVGCDVDVYLDLRLSSADEEQLPKRKLEQLLSKEPQQLLSKEQKLQLRKEKHEQLKAGKKSEAKKVRLAAAVLRKVSVMCFLLMIHCFTVFRQLLMRL
jgi:hypothetical protein